MYPWKAENGVINLSWWPNPWVRESEKFYIINSRRVKIPTQLPSSTFSISFPFPNYLHNSSHNGLFNTPGGERPRLLLERIWRNLLLPLSMVPRTLHRPIRNPWRRWTDFRIMWAIYDVSKGHAVRRPRNSRGNHAGYDPKGSESLGEKSLRLHGYGLVFEQRAHRCGW